MLASSVYDPDYTGAGHQPRGFDQIMPFYDHFVVRKSRIRASFTMTNSVCAVVGVQLNAVTTPETSFIDYAEQARCVVKVPEIPFASAGGIEPCVIEMEYSPESFLGIPDPLTATKLQGTISGNPTDNAFYHVFAQDQAEASTASACVLIEIIYDVDFIEPLAVARS
jgi:hypothetical protein